jgi:hypothetical protein
MDEKVFIQTMDRVMALFDTKIVNLQYQITQLNKRVADQDGTIAMLSVKDKLREGVLPTMDQITLIEVQIWDNEWEKLTPKQIAAKRKARHGPWSVRLTVSVNGRRFGGSGGELNVPLFPCNEFVEQVRKGTHVPEPIRMAAECAQGVDDPNLVAGMFNRRTSGAGTPRSYDHFVILRGHLENDPRVQVWSFDQFASSYECRKSAGAKDGRSKWYLKCKPNSM